ncbi:hypothetical protein [Zhihengliuella sp.]|uniref:hypothetical protein n=1 Tax=Zhihengliuella sp. TaxID=1954483 RepID=UPI002812418A|nr:hypothetical protein [Zhihengliuella sp.]
MMPWWFWILLWTVLALLALILLAVGAVYLFRKAMATVDAAGSAAEHLGGILQGAGAPGPDEADPQDEAGARAGGPVVGVAALFVDPGQAREDFAAGREERRAARIRRRIARKRSSGQPQRYGDVFAE